MQKELHLLENKLIIISKNIVNYDVSNALIKLLSNGKSGVFECDSYFVLLQLFTAIVFFDV